MKTRHVIDEMERFRSSSSPKSWRRLGRLLAAARGSLLLKLSFVGRATGLAWETVRRVEQGDRQPWPNTVAKLVGFYADAGVVFDVDAAADRLAIRVDAAPRDDSQVAA